MPFQVANAPHRQVVHGELSIGESSRIGARLLGSRLELHQTPGLHVRALEMASRLNQRAVYEDHYLALAEEFGSESWTDDERLFQAANSGVDKVRWLGSYSVLE